MACGLHAPDFKNNEQSEYIIVATYVLWILACCKWLAMICGVIFADGLKQETMSQLSTQKKKKGKGKDHNS